jgi:D-alanyl-lipoteichoic acid acyltransferase DltB (MBOAT superfamily)
MLFNSLTFFALFLPVLALYWLMPWQKARLALLFVASLVFYSYFHWPSVFLLLFTITFNYAMGLRQLRSRSRAELAVIIGVNLSLLLWFKYAGFIADNVNALLSLAGTHWAVPRPPAFLPLGISFFTFQVIAYQVDVHRGEIEPERSFLRFAVFKSFFPQLIAGPIVRAKDFLPQLRLRQRFDAGLFHHGLWLVLAGLALKIGIADVLAQFANQAFRDPSALSTSGAWSGLYAYAFQLFADFWGYSTIAVGLAAMFGLWLPLNFDTPYFSASLQEFWRRWHITLSLWFRDYVYIPLGGNRSNVARNLLVTMGLAGLWHGAGWTFVLWGLGHGLWLLAERSMPALPMAGHRLMRVVKTVLVFHGVCLLWVLFRSPTLQVAGEYFSRFLWLHEGSGTPGVLINWLVLIAIAQWPIAWSFKERRFPSLSFGRQWLAAAVCLYFILAYAGARVDFIYFNF